MGDKQLMGIKRNTVQQKKQFGQALNAKEFAVLAGISHSTAREWFHIPGFPALNGIVFWEDFVAWRLLYTGLIHNLNKIKMPATLSPALVGSLPSKARNLLMQA